MTARYRFRIVPTLAVVVCAACAGVAAGQSVPVGVRQIVVATAEDAQAVTQGLEAGDSFETLVTSRSLDPVSASRGGYLGRIPITDLRTEFQTALRDIGPGEVSAPVSVGGAFFLFQIVPDDEAVWLDADFAGVEALQQGRLEEAAGWFESAVSIAETFGANDARLARSLDSLAETHRLSGRPADAEPVYRRTLEVLEATGAPELDIAQVLNGLGLTLVALSRYDEAGPVFDRAEAIRRETLGPDHPEVAAIRLNRADLLASEGLYTDAVALYQEALAQLEEALGAQNEAVIATRERFGVFRQAVLLPELLDRFAGVVETADFRDEELDRQVESTLAFIPLVPFTEQAFVQMKDIFLQSGLADRAEQVLEVGLERFPDSRVLRVYLGELYAGTGRTSDALEILEEASLLPLPEGTDEALDLEQQGTIHQRIGDMHQALFEYDEAVRAYERALEINPESPQSLLKLGQSYVSTNQLDEAIVQFEHAAALATGDSEVQLNLVEAYLSAGRTDDAIAAADRAIALGTTDPRVLYLRGRALIQAGRREEGQGQLAEYQQVDAALTDAEHRSREVTAIKSAAFAAYLGGDATGALDMLREGVATYPDAGELQMAEGLMLDRLGRDDDAVRTFQGMLEAGIGRRFLVHKKLSEVYARVGDTAASDRHRALYEQTRDSELIEYAPQ